MQWISSSASHTTYTERAKSHCAPIIDCEHVWRLDDKVHYLLLLVTTYVNNNIYMPDLVCKGMWQSERCFSQIRHRCKVDFGSSVCHIIVLHSKPAENCAVLRNNPEEHSSRTLCSGNLKSCNKRAVYMLSVRPSLGNGAHVTPYHAFLCCQNLHLETLLSYINTLSTFLAGHTMHATKYLLTKYIAYSIALSCRPPVYTTQHPVQWVPGFSSGGKMAGVRNSSLISI